MKCQFCLKNKATEKVIFEEYTCNFCASKECITKFVTFYAEHK